MEVRKESPSKKLELAMAVELAEALEVELAATEVESAIVVDTAMPELRPRPPTSDAGAEEEAEETMGALLLLGHT